MIRKDLDLVGKERLQSRAAASLVQEACKYSARVLIEQGGKTVNAKSMMGVLSLGAQAYGTLSLLADGPDEKAAVAAIIPLMEQLFSKA